MRFPIKRNSKDQSMHNNIGQNPKTNPINESMSIIAVTFALFRIFFLVAAYSPSYKVKPTRKLGPRQSPAMFAIEAVESEAFIFLLTWL